MTEITIRKNDAGQRADRFLAKAYPNLKSSLVCKLMRKKRIKLNGAKTEPNVILKEGDVFRFYLSDELLSKEPLADKTDFRDISPEINVIYEDENILLIDKPAGLVVHEDNDNTADTLINRVLSYLYQHGEYDPERENSFTPALVNRIDRNTCGIVIAAKNAESLRILSQKVRDRELQKLYLCAVRGTPEPKSGTLTAYLKKLSEENRVVISDTPKPGFLTIKTKYRVLESRGELSLVEVDLLTGRTHQ
ncbi:MAG: RluA family pseudouridine synthase, partial [Oscillospiraceae bacterium]|nr:RluA family pseudouridine synthase [Oscillospiraceae bacterium]